MYKEYDEYINNILLANTKLNNLPKKKQNVSQATNKQGNLFKKKF